MSLEHAILGFLNYRSFTGYDLKKIFDTSVRHFWPADQAQIYRTLGRLSDRGFAEQERIEQSDRPDRKVYHITQAGRDELRRWLLTPLTVGENRSAPMVQVFFAGQLTDEEVLAIFERTAEMIHQVLAIYEQIPQQMDAYSDYVQSPREFTFWMMTLEVGILSAKTNLEYIENVIQRIRKGELPQH
jgi:PadR family transcriptional regulator, regulatory protein AphA